MFTLPLSPTDLVRIYEVKQEDKDFVLMVDYENSKKDIAVEHILIYISNTGFRATFSSIDDDILLKYISMNFLVDSPILSRIWANIIKVNLGVKLSDGDELLLKDFDRDSIQNFINSNKKTVNDLSFILRSLPVAIVSNIMESSEYESDDEVEVGINAGYVMHYSPDAIMAAISAKGIYNNVNTNIFNAEAKYYGGDIFKFLFEGGITGLITSMLPKEHEVFSYASIER